MNAATEAEHEYAALIARWNAVRTSDIAALNLKLKAAGLTEVGKK